MCEFFRPLTARFALFSVFRLLFTLVCYHCCRHAHRSSRYLLEGKVAHLSCGGTGLGSNDYWLFETINILSCDLQQMNGNDIWCAHSKSIRHTGH